jgi:hypothetical protein
LSDDEKSWANLDISPGGPARSILDGEKRFARGKLAPQAEAGPMTNTITLDRVAHARSGDKGNHANIGVIAYTAEGYDWLRNVLTAERVADYFAGLSPSRVERYELPRLWAFNFLLYDALAGGASQSPRIDTQGKLLSTAIAELRLPEPEHLDRMLRVSD